MKLLEIKTYLLISKKPTKLKRNRIIEIFDDVENFKYYHNRKQNLNNIEDLMMD